MRGASFRCDPVCARLGSKREARRSETGSVDRFFASVEPAASISPAQGIPSIGTICQGASNGIVVSTHYKPRQLTIDRSARLDGCAAHFCGAPGATSVQFGEAERSKLAGRPLFGP